MSLTEQDVLEQYAAQDGKCFWFGVEMIPSVGIRDPQRPSIDRLDNSRGYTPDNIVLACIAANVGRSNSDILTFASFCADTLKCPIWQ